MKLKFGKLCRQTKCFYVFLALFVIIIIYGIILHVTNSFDILNKKLINFEVFGQPCCSWWPISHFILYLILGFLFPDYQLEFILIGIGWELLECLMGRICRQFSSVKKEEDAKGVEYVYWMSGSFKDIIFNIAGLYTGVLLNRIIN